MMQEAVFLYAGSAIIFVWGAAHILAAAPVAKGFGAQIAQQQVAHHRRSTSRRGVLSAWMSSDRSR